MNIYHLELFYHVSLHGGVSQAAKALDREQPTVSKQVNELEDSLRTKLYQRRPFKLTEKGELLFQSIEPFFRELPKLEQKVKGTDTIRIGASPIVLTEHLPAVEKQVRKKFPNLHLVLREANQPQLSQWIEKGEIDLAITLLPRVLPQKVFAKQLLEIPMVLLVPKSCKLTSAEMLWTRAEVHEGLICLTPDEMVCREFQEELKRREVEWRPRIEVGSLHLVEHYVRKGYGIGLSVAVPGPRRPRMLRALPLVGFPAVPLGMLWRDNEDRLLRAFREQVEARAVEFSI